MPKHSSEKCVHLQVLLSSVSFAMLNLFSSMFNNGSIVAELLTLQTPHWSHSFLDMRTVL
jgi:hypothetical protein